MTGFAAASTRAGRAVLATPEDLTQVELVWIEKQVEHWIRFGREVREQVLDRRRRILFFPTRRGFRAGALGRERARHRALPARHPARRRTR